MRFVLPRTPMLSGYLKHANSLTQGVSMPTIHFLNVKEGDCSIIKHISDHVTVMDVCNAKPVDATEELLVERAKQGVLGNFNQKRYPVNPVAYMKDHSL